jgi:glycosyltransferase involved in cell wall biosynthesis
MNCKVTVLVAVYNTARFLPQCLDSLLGQTLQDLQVVCIDDSSTDDSLHVLRQYAVCDPRIEVIALTENHGQAYARNQGLLTARGEYVCFLDSDDWLSPDALEKAVAVFEAHAGTDCVLFQVDIMHPDNVERYPLPPFDVLTGMEAFHLSLDWQIHGVYMVRAVLHQRFPYDDTCRSFSDDNTTRLHYINACEVRQCQGVYYYRQHEVSTSHVVSVRQFDRLRANESMKSRLEKLGVDERVMRKWETIRMLTLVDCYMFYHLRGHELSPTDRSYALSELHRVWGNIDRSLLDPLKTNKFGYRPMPSWWLFRLQEWAYFTLRGLRGKNRYY